MVGTGALASPSEGLQPSASLSQLSPRAKFGGGSENLTRIYPVQTGRVHVVTMPPHSQLLANFPSVITTLPAILMYPIPSD